jgi:hypothetical protein
MDRRYGPVSRVFVLTNKRRRMSLSPLPPKPSGAYRFGSDIF